MTDDIIVNYGKRPENPTTIDVLQAIASDTPEGAPAYWANEIWRSKLCGR